jgi:CubicO group peptidase (beta-lactamase class C family)
MIRSAIPRLVLVAAVLLSAAARAEEAPPIAAPTSRVAVSALPVVRSASQQIDDFSSGLLQGLQASENIPGLAFIVVEGDHVMLQKSLGVTDPQSLTPINGDTVFEVGSLAGAMIGLAAMQQIEAARILAADDVGMLLGDNDWRGITVAQLLTHQVPDAAVPLARIVERSSGQAIGSYVESRLFGPLGMTRSHFENGVFTTSASDMGRLLSALLNGGAAAERRILAPETIALMARTHRTVHQALPGWTYVFAELRRGGWRALQYDGVTDAAAARLVFEPEAQIGYFLVVNRNPGPTFWRVADSALFDRIFPPRGGGAVELRGVPAPTAENAEDVAGTYLAERGAESDVLALRSVRARLRIDAREDGALVLSGAENAVLVPRPGGTWRSNEAQLNAAVLDGKLLLDQFTYDRFRLWERPGWYAWLGFLLALAATALMIRPQRAAALIRLKERHAAYAGPGLLAASFFLLLLAVILQRLAFVA